MCVANNMQQAALGVSMLLSGRISDIEKLKFHWNVRRVGGAHTCLAPIMLQDHRQLDNSLICRVILI
ncbi:hypothetical protein Ahy_A03g013569 [Arachis hypogaea]|uniref:Uncharacterized protein n=1 Tax=Arachis hypogaea TaxID=3818 RepID=A0A445DVN9_ARAHY|nr:hypothetical protein Ahy_A03g013569 [Arachis hypogaea]